MKGLFASGFGLFGAPNSSSGGSLPSGQILVGNGSGIASAVNMSGDATITNAGVVAVSNVSGIAVPSDDLTANGYKLTLTAGENLVFGNICYIKSDGKIWKADANSAGLFPAQLLALGTISADASGSFLVAGIARNDAWSWTVGSAIYLSIAVGTMTQTQPSATDDCIQVLGFATHADRMLFNPSPDYITST